jgi:hypothetical protein
MHTAATAVAEPHRLARRYLLAGVIAFSVLVTACGSGAGEGAPAGEPSTAPTSQAETATGEVAPEAGATTAPPPNPPTSPPPSAPPGTVEISYRGGEVQRSDRRVEVSLGQPVRLVVSSDVADEVHVHGYDKTAEVPAGGTAVIEFPATIPGVFEVELEQRSVPLVELAVR